MRKFLALSVVALILAGCGQPKKVVGVFPPLITADVTPVLSKSKKSVGVSINFKNIAHADYDYARFKLTAYNNSGNVIKPKKGKRDSAFVRLAGPIAPGSLKTTTWTNTWANRQVQCITLDEVELIFADGSVEVAKGGRLLNTKENKACI